MGCILKVATVFSFYISQTHSPAQMHPPKYVMRHAERELERIDKGLAPLTFQDDVQVVGFNSGSSSWDVESLLMSSGVV